MMAPTSKTALSVQQQAPPRCTLWFLCKGNLICTRLATAPIPVSRSMKSEEDAAAAAAAERKGGPGQQPLGTFIQGLGRDSTSSFGDEPPPPSISGPGYPQLPPAAADSEMMMYNKQKQDMQSIFEEAEKLRRERHIPMMPAMMRREHHQAAGGGGDHERVEELELQLVSSRRVINDLQDKLSEAHCMLFSLEREQEDLRRQRDDAVREAAALRDKVRQLELARGFTELSYDDLREATNNLDEALKLTQHQQGGGYGAVYKGKGLHDQYSWVSIKVLNPHGLRQQAQVQAQVQELRKLRHPNLVPLLGACLVQDEQQATTALVYEFLPGAGSLDERLPHLPWAHRTRVAADICSGLVYLHQNGMVHGDLKPGNVLLLLDDGGGMAAKLTDYGLCRMLDQGDAGAVLTRCATSLAYMDPEFLASGELRPSSDVYALGVLLLRLLTGRPPNLGLLKQVQAALLPPMALPDILDPAAGDWPQEQAEQLARLAVACCEIASTNRPDLAGEMVARTLGCF